MAFYSRNTKKDIKMTEEDKEDFENYNLCRFCEKEKITDKVRDDCHLTRKYRGAAHNICSSIVTQKKKYFIPFVFHNFPNYDCHLFFKKLLDIKKDKVNFEIFPKKETKNIYQKHVVVIDL